MKRKTQNKEQEFKLIKIASLQQFEFCDVFWISAQKGKNSAEDAIQGMEDEAKDAE